jgi:phosphoglycolate phosphatase-like HAD superfamily hydrolase
MKSLQDNQTLDVKGVVLDVDGTLVDSNHQHACAWCAALEASGFAAPYATVRRLIGMGGDKLFPRMTGFAEDTPIGVETGTRRAEIFRSKYLPHLEPFAGTREMVKQWLDAGIAIAIASSADKRDLMDLLKIANVDDLIEQIASSEDAERSKPDPGIVKAAVDKLKVPRGHVLMVGDTPYDVEAAALAGIRTIAFRSGGWADEELVGALHIYDGPWACTWQLDCAPSRLSLILGRVANR